MLAYMPSMTYMPTYICKHICKINVYVCGSIYVTYMTYMKMAQFHICRIYIEYMYMYVTYMLPCISSYVEHICQNICILCGTCMAHIWVLYV